VVNGAFGRKIFAAVAAAALLALAAPFAAAAAPQRNAAAVQITVSAAASLKDALAEIVKGFARARPDVAIDLNLSASGTLATQI